MSETPSTSTLSRQAELALSRSQVYSFLARAFLYPREALLEQLLSAHESLLSLGLAELATALNPLKDVGHSVEERQSDYLQAFGHTVSPDSPPYEAEYGNTSIYQQATRLGDVAAFYRSSGLESTSEERLDHIGVEMEFMYFLTFKEAFAWERYGAEKAGLCREMQKTFLEGHLGCWAPLFLRLLERKTTGRFYQVVASVGRQFLATDAQLMGAQPKLLAETDLSSRALQLKSGPAWEVKDCGEDCI
ncbi:MAG: molecular chaperone TorD family protein [Chloroflexi bacterium]|nr:molecular chaperone TorD family protein [Chloroflexota bacterium]